MCAAGFFLMTEEQGNAPKTGQSHQAENDAAEQRGLSAKQESNNVEAEQADAAQFSAPMIARVSAILSQSIISPPFRVV